MKKENRILEVVLVAVAMAIIAAVTAFPFLHEGLYGYAPDYIYHMNRIEGVKEALLSGNYPVYVYSNFFGGKGYGSPMFYPDLFLIIPAIMRIMGVSILTTYKIFAVVVCLLATISTYVSLKVVSGDKFLSLSGTFLLMLSEFYLADLIFRAGYSSYISYIFLPILFAGIYDFFMRDGMKCYLIGIGLGGLVLCHIINSFIALLLTTAVFVVQLLTKKGREAFFEKKHLINLAVTAVITLLITGYYTFPMIEQMVSGVERVYQDPWAHVGEFVQPFETLFLPTGYFFNIAYVGVGIPILLLIGLFAKKVNDRMANFYFVLGILLLLAMTKIVPWEKLEGTVLNQLQFTFRLYPFALCALIFGMVLTGKETIQEKGRIWLLVYAVVMTTVFGIWQNKTALAETYGYFNEVNEDIIAQNSETVGRGEWLPVVYNDEELRERNIVRAEDNSEQELPYERYENKVGGSFEAEEAAFENYTVPQIYYKGYSAVLETSDGEKYNLSCREAFNGLTTIDMPSETIGKSGVISVSYSGTTLQKITLALSVLTVVTFVVLLIVLKVRKKGGQK